MKDNKDEVKVNKEEKINDKKDNKNTIPFGKKNLFYKGQKDSISANYFMNIKQNKSKIVKRNSFVKEIDKKNQISTMKAEKKLLNKTSDINNNNDNNNNNKNNNKNSIKNNNQNQNQNKLIKRNSLCLNPKKDNNATTNNQKNFVTRKSMIIMNKNNDNKLKKMPDKRKSYTLQNNKNNVRINKDKSNTILEKILEKNEDKRDIDYNEINENYESNENNRGRDIRKETKNKSDYRRAYSRKQTEKDREKKMNKLNKKDFGAVEKYTKKAMPFLKREQKDNKNIINNIKYKNQKIYRTKTNYDLAKNANRIINNSNIIKNKNNNNNNNDANWSNRNLPEIKSKFNNLNLNKAHSNLYDKYYNKNKIVPKNNNNKNYNRNNNPLFKTITLTKNPLNKKKKVVKSKDKNLNIKFRIINKKRIHNRSGSMVINDTSRGKSALTLRVQKSNVSKKIANINNKNDKNKNKNNKVLNKTFIQKDKRDIKEKEKEKKKEEIKSEKNNKNEINLKQKKTKDESDSDSDSDDDEDDENDFDIYAMIRSKSCAKRKKEKNNSESENSEQSEEKSFDSEEECDIESILYGKQPKKIFYNIDDDDNEDRNTVVKCIDFNEVYLTSINMFTENIERNNLYKKYIPKFDEIFNKVILKIKEKKQKINIKKDNDEKSINNTEKENQNLEYSEITKDDSLNKNTN